VTYGGDSGNRIFVVYWRCPLIRVSVIRGSTVYTYFFLNFKVKTSTFVPSNYKFSRPVTQKYNFSFYLQATCFGYILSHQQTFSKKTGTKMQF
jgi:hypothetical protein